MSDEFGTVNQRRTASRDLELLRKHYQQHRETLRQLASEPPSEFLAGEYQRLIRDIDLSLKKVDEMESRKAGAAAAAASTAAATGAAISADNQPTMKLNAGSRPLTPSPVSLNDRLAASSAPNPATRVALILIAGVVVLGLVGWLIWRATTDRGDEGRIADSQPVTNTEPVMETGTIEPINSLDSDSLKIVPPDVKFGTVRKGTRVVRQIEITNTSDQPISIALERSNCRCLFYEYANEIKPKAKESVTVSLDGARAKVGELRETIGVTAKNDPSVKTAFNVTANIR